MDLNKIVPQLVGFPERVDACLGEWPQRYSAILIYPGRISSFWHEARPNNMRDNLRRIWSVSLVSLARSAAAVNAIEL